MLRLEFKDTPVTEAVKQLVIKSGYRIVIQGDSRKLAERKVTLDTGETTFWQAFDQLCQKAGLVQVTNLNANPRFGNPPLNGIQVQPLPIQAIPGGAAPQAVPQKNNQEALEREVREALAKRAEAIDQLRRQVQILAEAGGKQAVAPPVQAPAAQVPQPPVRGGAVIMPPAQPVGQTQLGQINVAEGKVEDFPTHYAGSVRFRVVPYDRASMSMIREKSPGETLLILEICAEPKLTNFRVEGTARVDKALDDQGQELTTVMDPMPNAVAPVAAPNGRMILRQRVMMPSGTGTNRELVPIRLKQGEKPAKVLKELAGSVTVECLSPPVALLAIDDVMKAAGKGTTSKEGGSMDVVEISKLGNGDVRLKVRWSSEQGAMARGAIMAGGGRVVQFVGGIGNDNTLPELLDAKGKAYQLSQIQSRNTRGINNVFSQEATLVYRPAEGQGDPTRLVLNGRRDAHVQVTYRLKDVTLP
jgi:hypothetical protein